MSTPRKAASSAASATVARFRASLVIDHEKWHDGIGFDLDAIRSATPEERHEIERLLLSRPISDWRDVEALAAIGSTASDAALRKALRRGSKTVKTAILQYAPRLLTERSRTEILVSALESATLDDGLSGALDEVPEFHPPAVISALRRGLRERSGDIAVNFAAMLFHVHGKASEPFDWSQRPFFLQFNTEDSAERAAAIRELEARLGIDPETSEPKSES